MPKCHPIVNFTTMSHWCNNLCATAFAAARRPSTSSPFVSRGLLALQGFLPGVVRQLLGPDVVRGELRSRPAAPYGPPLPQDIRGAPPPPPPQVLRQPVVGGQQLDGQLGHRRPLRQLPRWVVFAVTKWFSILKREICHSDWRLPSGLF